MSFKVYFDPLTKNLYQTDINNFIPETAKEISDKTRWEILEKVKDGYEIGVDESGYPILVPHTVNTDDLELIEKTWRDKELLLADFEINKLQDGDKSSVGTIAKWRNYRKELRHLPELLGFPISHQRPIKPT